MRLHIQYPAHSLNYSSNSRNPWTDEDVLRLLELRANKVPYTKIARELQRSHRAILCQLRKYKLIN